MSTISFSIPSERSKLLSEITSNYVVKNVVIPGEIVAKLEEARICFRDEGADFILDNFDTFYSVLHHAETLQRDIVFRAYIDLQRAVRQLDNAIGFLLDDKDNLNEELKEKMATVIKMLLYIYCEFVIYLDKKRRHSSDDAGSRGRKKQKQDEDFNVDKSKALSLISNIIGKDISLFWDPPVVEHEFVTLLAELCHSFLQNPMIKQEKENKMEIFGMFGNLIKSYDYGKTFVTRLIQLIRMYEHVVHCVPEGVKLVVEQFNCRGLVHHFVKEATEWQVDETFPDNQGTKCCSIFLTELAVLLPDLMIPEVMYLNQFLSYESPPLRVSILNVITEVILKVLTKHDLSEEEKESRDEFLDVLIEHIHDVTAVVRAKVIQNLTKLQKENAIPLDYQNDVLEKIRQRLLDKGALVRKAAINCITTFLEHNPFGANLQLNKTEEELAKKVELLNRLESSYKEAKRDKMEQLESEWSKIEDEVKNVIKQELQNKSDDEETDDEEEPQTRLDKDQIIEIVRSKLEEKKYPEAVRSCRLLRGQIGEWKNMKQLNEENEVNLYLTILRSFFLNAAKLTDELRTGAGMTAEDVRKIETLENIITYLEQTTSFLRIIDNSIPTLKSMLFSQTVSDMHEAIHFFVTAYQFQINNASEGVLGMLRLMQYSEPERKEAVVEAFKTIYLTTDTSNMAEHTTTILNRLIALQKEITYNHYDDFVSIVAEWTSKGILDNSVIDKCWQYYTQRERVSKEEARAAADLLRMAALGRHTIITKNINVVTTVAFSENFKDDMMFLASSCRLLAEAGEDKIDIQSKNSPFKVNHADPMFQTLTEILVDNFFKKVPYYTNAMQAGLDFVFKVCSKPPAICEKIVRQIHERMEKEEQLRFLVTRFCELLGYTAFRILGYFDNTVYRELKRRNYLRESLKENNKNKQNRKSKSRASSNSAHIISEASVEESVLMGADAEDTDAEFILNVLENDIVLNSGFLACYTPYLTSICQRQDLYDNLLLQQTAITALMRYMLVSSKFCREHIRLLFTVFEKTTYPEVKCTILVHSSDLLTRFPNVVEPWSPRMYERLKDPLVQVRKTAFFTLSNLILRDMIRAHSHISEMAACLIDQDQEVCNMCRQFFARLAQKENNLANVIPDIFSHLVKSDDINEDNLRFIMKFLFDLVDNSKRTENLVDRFCCKYTPSEDLKLNRNITYCLSLINYNDKALKKLHEKFPMYKHHIHDAEIYATFKQILAECNKPKVGKADLKAIVTDIENCISSVFEIDENGQPAKPPPVAKSTKKSRNNSNRKKSARKQTKSSESESDFEEATSSKKGRRVRKAQNSKISSDSD